MRGFNACSFLGLGVFVVGSARRTRADRPGATAAVVSALSAAGGAPLLVLPGILLVTGFVGLVIGAGCSADRHCLGPARSSPASPTGSRALSSVPGMRWSIAARPRARAAGAFLLHASAAVRAAAAPAAWCWRSLAIAEPCRACRFSSLGRRAARAAALPCSPPPWPFDAIRPRAASTRRPDCAFWLHLLAAPLIVHWADLSSLRRRARSRLHDGIALFRGLHEARADADRLIFSALALLLPSSSTAARCRLGTAYARLGRHRLARHATAARRAFAAFAGTLSLLGALVFVLGVGWIRLRRC